jgi:hypothetical protein
LRDSPNLFTEFGRKEKIQITTYLYLPSSNKKSLQKNLKIMFNKVNHAQFRNIMNMENQIKSKLITEAERRKINSNHKQGISNISLKQSNQVAATEKIVLNLCSNQESVPLRKHKQTENMSSNILNKQPFELDKNNYLLSKSEQRCKKK